MVEFEHLMETCSSQRALPLVIACFLSSDKPNHFQAIRYTEPLYWKYLHGETEASGPGMRARVDTFHRLLQREIVSAAMAYEFDTEDEASGSDSDNAARVQETSDAPSTH